MSIADGQIILQRTPDGAVALDFANSLSRMGLRAYAPAMQTLCPPIRLRLSQVLLWQLMPISWQAGLSLTVQWYCAGSRQWKIWGHTGQQTSQRLHRPPASCLAAAARAACSPT